MPQQAIQLPPKTTPPDTSNLVVNLNGEPQFALIEYDIYLLLQKVIAELRIVQGLDISPPMWTAIRKQIQVLDIMLASARISDQIEKDPSTLVSHAELKRQLAEKKAALERQHVAA